MLRGNAHRLSLFTATALCLAQGAQAGGIDLSIDPGSFADGAAPRPGGEALSGIDLALRNPLLSLDVGYDLAVKVGEDFTATDDSTTQRLGATLRCKPLDRLLQANTLVRANSLYTTATGGYNHRLVPGLSRSLLDVATVDVNYQYQLNRPHADAAELEMQGYSLGLRGSLHGGRVHWNGRYIADDTYRDRYLRTQSSQTYRFQSDLKLLPQMHLQLSGALIQRTQYQATQDVNFLQTQYGAGLQWSPSPQYAIDVRVDQTDWSHTGEEMLLRRGSVSWYPNEDVTLSLNYGDQLVEGTPGVLVNTRLVLDHF
ncbi:MAG: hypothetical protein CME59_06275 [Halioglobus sp.]|nr:hypothetical protein [Halioglobus sp.]